MKARQVKSFSLVRLSFQIRLTYLIDENVGTKVLERQLELLQAVVDGDFDGDGSIRAGIIASVMARSGHDEMW